MPELPEVETVCRGLNQWTLNQTIMGGEVLLKRTLAYPLSVSEFWQQLEGTAIAHWQRRGKYLLASLIKENTESGGKLGFHLRMTGQLLWLNRDESLSKHTRIRLFLGEKKELRFVDIRTFGKAWYVPPNTAPEMIISGLRKLGPEPFASEFSLEYFSQQIKASRRPIKTLLLAQELVAGIGNIYADEALFKSSIRPTTLGKELKPEKIERLRIAIIEVLQTAIEQGGTTFSDFRSVTGINGNYGGLAWVYGRNKQPCRLCGTTIEQLKLGGRSAHFCPHCQS